MKAKKSKGSIHFPLPNFLSEDECEEIIVSACTVRPHTEEELTALIRWAEMTRMDNMLLGMTLNGKLMVEWTPENEPSFKAVNAAPGEKEKP